MSNPKGKFTVQTLERMLPNGILKRMDMVDHPGAVLIVPFVSETRIILLQQYRPTLDKFIFELPCGTIDPNESALRCAKRELVEETGFGARKLSKLGELYPAPGYTNEIIYVFQAENLFASVAQKDDDEIIQTLEISSAEIKQMITSGRLCDAKSIAALALCGWLI